MEIKYNAFCKNKSALQVYLPKAAPSTLQLERHKDAGSVFSSAGNSTFITFTPENKEKGSRAKNSLMIIFFLS